MEVGEEAAWVIGKYFGSWSGGIDYERFAVAMRPRVLVHEMVRYDEDDPIEMFLRMVGLAV
jgi:hypothetical protein